MYEVVNPIIIGDFDSQINESVPEKAAGEFWKRLSGIIIGEIPNTYFTLKSSEGKLHHFQVSEKKNGENMADYTIMELNEPVNDNIIMDKYNSFVKRGGNKNDDSSSTSSSTSFSTSSSTSDYDYDYDYKILEKIALLRKKYVDRQLFYYHYSPFVYPRIKNLYVPIFNYPHMALYIKFHIDD